MNQAMRWKRFIEWWNKYEPDLENMSVGMLYLLIDEKIDSIKNGDK